MIKTAQGAKGLSSRWLRIAVHQKRKSGKKPKQVRDELEAEVDAEYK